MEKVYLIQNTRTGHLKIGYTRGKVQARLRQLQTGNADRLKCLATLRGSTKYEAMLHRRYRADRLHGEWFRNRFAIHWHFMYVRLVRRLRLMMVIGAVLLVALWHFRPEVLTQFVGMWYK